MNNNKEGWNLKDALAFYDYQIDGRKSLSRIFIEPPDEANTSCEDTDDEVPATICTTSCEVILRNGKRVKSAAQNEVSVSKKIKTNKNRSSSLLKRNSKCDIRETKIRPSRQVISTKNSKCDEPSSAKPKCSQSKCDKSSPQLKNRPRRRVATQNTKCDEPSLSKQKCYESNCFMIDPDENSVTMQSPNDDEPENEKEAKTPTKNSVSKSTKDYVWIKDSSKPMIPIFPSPNYTDCTAKTSIEQFETFFDDGLLTLITEQSSKYAEYLGKPDPNITIKELKVYIGILVISGYSVQSRLESYWSSDPDLRNESIYRAMRKNRFKQITQFLHFKDMNEPNTDDKIWKLRPLTDHLKMKMLLNFHPEQDLSYDESMIEYYGRHGMKQCLKDKPIPFGFKVWSLCTPAGYLANFEIYQGKNPRSKTVYEERFGKCIAPLFNMIDDFTDDVRALPFSFYFDNLFTGIPALAQLKSLGYNGTGTIRENRLPKGCPLKEDKKKTAKLGRGYMTSKSIQGLDIHVTKWVDNSVVSVASTVYGIDPATTALRYSSVKKKKIEVPRPLVVAKYNKSMGGVDRMDENISLYRIGIHGKKWWSCIFTWMIDVSIQNAWQLHRVARTPRDAST